MFDTVPETGIWDVCSSPRMTPLSLSLSLFFPLLLLICLSRSRCMWWPDLLREQGRRKMQSVIAIIIIELMYLLGVLGKCWLGWKRSSFCLTEAVSSIRAMCGAGIGLLLSVGCGPVSAVQLIWWIWCSFFDYKLYLLQNESTLLPVWAKPLSLMKQLDQIPNNYP